MEPLWTQVSRLDAHDIKFYLVTTLAVVALVYFAYHASVSKKTLDFPYEGKRWWFEPDFWIRWRFVFGGQGVVNAGYLKHKGKPFVVRRNDVDILILPAKLLEDIKGFTRAKFNSLPALNSNCVGHITGASALLKSDLHIRVVRNYLTPNMGEVMVQALDEMNHGWNMDFPSPTDWTEVDIQNIIRKHIGRISARAFIGKCGSRNEKWIDTSIAFSTDFFVLSLTLRLCPPWMHPFMLPFLPPLYRVKRQYNEAYKALLPEMNRYRDVKARGIKEEENFSLLHGMIDDAKGEEADDKNIVTLQIITSLAGIHTSAMLTSYIIFELCRRPEYLPDLIKEAEETMAKGSSWVRTSHKEMMKLDSFICEVIRFNPPVNMLPHRRAIVPFTLSDGTHVPQGAQVAFPMMSINEDPDIIDNPAVFDGYRKYKRRQQMGAQAGAEDLATTASPDHLTFGYGVQLCPGRFFAINEIKMIMSRFLTEYEFKMTEPMKQRRNFFGVQEFFIPNPFLKIQMRRKPNA